MGMIRSTAWQPGRSSRAVSHTAAAVFLPAGTKLWKRLQLPVDMLGPVMKRTFSQLAKMAIIQKPLLPLSLKA